MNRSETAKILGNGGADIPHQTNSRVRNFVVVVIAATGQEIKKGDDTWAKWHKRLCYNDKKRG